MLKKNSVVFISGSGRSGTTIVDRILGTIPEAVTVSQLYHIIFDLYHEEVICSCGNQTGKCEFWTLVIKKLSLSKENIKKITRIHEEINHSRYFFNILFGTLSNKKKVELKYYLKWLETLYDTIFEITKKNIIIDSSKVPSHILLLSKINKYNISDLHIIRHPSGVVKSWQKNKYDPSKKKFMNTHSTHKILFNWIIRNSLSNILKYLMPYKRYNYEKIIDNPDYIFNQVLKNFKIKTNFTFNIKNKSILLESNHTLSGNPHRFHTGKINLIKDESWKKEISLFKRIYIFIFLLPLMVKYKYGI
jgi:hypothetical protein